MNRSQLHYGQWLVSLLAFSLLACEGWVAQKPTDSRSRSLATTAPTPNEAEPPRSEVLVIGQQVLATMNHDLRSQAQLSSSQADFVTGQAEQHLATTAGTIAIGTNLTADASPIEVVSPTLIEGAFAALNKPEAGLSGADQRRRVIEVVLSSSFGSLRGLADGLAQERLLGLSSTMVEKAVGNLGKAGLREDDAVKAVQAVTAGATAALTAADFKGASPALVAKTVLKTTVGNLASLDLGKDPVKAASLLSSAIGQATEGAVGNASKVGLEQSAAVSFIGQLSALSLAAAADLSKAKTPSLNLQTTIAEVARGSVGGLQKAGKSEAELAPSLQSITSAMLNSLPTLGLAKEGLINGAAAVASGSIAGALGLQETIVTSKELVNQVVGGTVKSLPVLSLAELERANTVSLIVSQSLAALPAAGVTNQKNIGSAAEQAVKGALGGLTSAGLNNQTILNYTLEQIGRATTAALPSAGVDKNELASVSAAVTTTSVRLIAENQLAADTATLSSAASQLVKGSMQGISSLQAQNIVSSTVVQTSSAAVLSGSVQALVAIKNDTTLASKGLSLSTAELGTITADVAAGALAGLAGGGMSAAEVSKSSTAVTTQVSTDLRTQGVSDAQISQLSQRLDSETEKVVDLASKLATADTSLPLCRVSYSDQQTDASFFAALPAASAGALYCRLEIAEACPKARSNESFKLQWALSPLKTATASQLCELLRLPQPLALPSSFAIVSPGESINQSSLTLSWNTATGASYYSYTVARDQACFLPVQSQKTTANSALVQGLTDGTYYLCVTAYNAQDKATPAQNIGLRVVVNAVVPVAPVVPVVVAPDLDPPTATSISINAGAATTTSTTVTLSLGATDATEVYITNVTGCASAGNWEPYTTSKPWTLGQTNGTATVYAKFRDAAGNASACISDTITHTSGGQAPTGGSLSINSGDAATALSAVTLTIAATGASSMYITNTSSCASDGTWQAYATSAPWTLGQSNATASVYMKFKDSFGNESACVSDTIIHDNLGPSGATISIDSGASVTKDNPVSLALSASDPVSMYITETAGCTGGGTWEAFAGTKSWTLAATNTSATVYVKFKDALGNESFCVNDNIIHDSIAPTGTSIAINAGAAYTNSTSATLTLAGSGATSMYITSTTGCGTGGTWEPFATSKVWTLVHLNATATVYFKLKDDAGNETSCLSDTILHDSQGPTATSFTFSGGFLVSGIRYVSSSSVSLTLSAADAAHMMITSATNCASGSWVTYATTYSYTLNLNAANTLYAKFKDDHGNESPCMSPVSITHDNIPPSGSFNIGASGEYTSSTSVTLFPSSSTASEMYITNTIGCATGGAWETYVASRLWTLGQTNAVATVYIKFRDQARNESTCLNDTIVHDNIDPSVPNVLGGSLLTASPLLSPVIAWNASNDAGSGLSHYSVSIGSTAGGSNFASSNNIPSTTLSTVLQTASLSVGTPYYITVKAWDRAGNYSSSDGQFNYTQWKQQAYIKPVNNTTIGYEEASFGAAVALYEDTLAVGASNEPSSQAAITNGATASTSVSAPQAGAVYVYLRTGTAWAQQSYIKAANAEGTDQFGVSVTLSGDTLAVGAWREDSNQTSITNGTTASTDNTVGYGGAVYVYSRTGVNWLQQAYIKAPNVNADDVFGWSVALSGNTLAIGAFGEDSSQTTITNGTTASPDNSAEKAGAVYVYQRTGTQWTQQAYIKAANTQMSKEFGGAVSLDGNILAVGARFDKGAQTTITNGPTADTTGSLAAGAAYIYRRNGTAWAQEAYIKAANRDDYDSFGERIALSNDTVAVAAMAEDSNVTTISATASADNSNTDSGAVYIYKSNGTNWSQQAYLKASNNAASAHFGSSLSLYGDRLVVGATGEKTGVTSITNGTLAPTNPSINATGAAYVYRRNATSWAQESFIKAQNGTAGDAFGYTVSLDGSTIAVGAPEEDSNQTSITNGTGGASTDDSRSNSGAVYIYAH